MSYQILIIGAGNMGSALARGLAGKNFRYRIHDQHPARLARLKQETGSEILDSLDQPVSDDAVVLCVKPQDMPVVAGALAGKMKKDVLIISILAGITTSDLEEAFASTGPIVRAMPNICATVGEAATVVAPNSAVSEVHRDLVENLFGGIGECHWADESLMDAVTGLSGSGPAYLYMIIEALTDGGVKMGIPRRLAAALATQTVVGSGKLVKESGLHPAILRDQVTTPGGTTINAIHELEARGLRAMLISAVQTATERSADLRAKAQKKSSLDKENR